MTPKAIPVNAECPNAYEKNAILLLTTILPNSPNKSPVNKIAIKAFFIKFVLSHSKGNKISINLYKISINKLLSLNHNNNTIIFSKIQSGTK